MVTWAPCWSSTSAARKPLTPAPTMQTRICWLLVDILLSMIWSWLCLRNLDTLGVLQQVYFTKLILSISCSRYAEVARRWIRDVFSGTAKSHKHDNATMIHPASRKIGALEQLFTHSNSSICESRQYESEQVKLNRESFETCSS